MSTRVFPPKLKLPGEGEELSRGHEAVAGILTQVIRVLHGKKGLKNGKKRMDLHSLIILF
jgi:hypothetical protein